MTEIACYCGGLPAHDHYMGFHCPEGVWRARWDPNDVGRVWVNWKEVARALMKDASPQPPPSEAGKPR